MTGPAREADALTAVLVATSPDLLAYFQHRTDSEDAADLLAETMMTAWRRVEVLPDDPEERRRWLFGIARNVLLNVERGERRRWRLAARVRDLVATREHVTDGADAGAEVRDAIARLEPELAELVRLVHWDGFTLVEAGAVLGIPASTARGRYQRAKAVLRAALEVGASQPHV